MPTPKPKAGTTKPNRFVERAVLIMMAPNTSIIANASANVARVTKTSPNTVLKARPTTSKTAPLKKPIESSPMRRVDSLILTTTMKVKRAITSSTIVSNRFPNSITPWKPISGVLIRESSVHLGQVGQPKPLPVRRTAPPVTTIKIWVTSDSQTNSRNRSGDTMPLNQRPFRVFINALT